MLNDLDRFHLVMDVIDRVPALAATPRCCASAWPTPGSPPAATPASTARTTRRSPAGPGRVSRVLVVNAGSSSLKLRLLGGDDTVEQAADVEAGRTVWPATT